MNSKLPKTAFVVLSCDAYSDLWPMFSFFFDKNWKDCPYDKYFVSNHKPFFDKNFNNILIGSASTWSKSLLEVIALLKNKYTHLFLTLEDFPILNRVDNQKLKEIENNFFNNEGNFLTFRAQPEPTKSFNEFFGLIEPGSLYRPCCVYALWNIAVLEDLLREEENAWQFERFGSIRSDKYDGFYVVYRNFFEISNTVVKGLWLNSEYKKIVGLGFKPDLTNRKLFRYKNEVFLKLYTLLFTILTKYQIIHWRIRRNVIFKLRGYTYKN